MVVTSSVCHESSPTLQSGGHNQKWSPTLQSKVHKRKIKVAHKCASLQHHARRLGGSLRLRSRLKKTKVAHTWASWPHHPCRVESPQLFKRGYKIRSAQQRRRVAISLPPPRRGCPTLRSTVQNKRGVKMHLMGMSPPPFGASPRLQSGGTKTQVHTSGLWGHINLAFRQVSKSSKQETKSELPHKWA